MFFFNMARTIVWHVLVQSWQGLFLWPGEVRHSESKLLLCWDEVALR